MTAKVYRPEKKTQSSAWMPMPSTYNHTELGAIDGHAVLDVAGLVPVVGEVFDLANGIWYSFEGDKLNAGISFAALLPIGGQLATGTRLGIKIMENTGECVAKSTLLLAQFSSSALNKGVKETIKKKWTHIVNGKLHPKHYLTELASANGGVHKFVGEVLNKVTTNTVTNDAFRKGISIMYNGRELIVRGNINSKGIPVINTIFDPLIDITK